MTFLAWYALAAFCEIAGCYAFWCWLHDGKTPLLAIPGVCSLIIFAWALTRVDKPNAGRVYAVYGGIYIVGAILWLWFDEGVRPDRWDILGCIVCLCGAAIIYFAKHQPT
jgi:small multidrug resistance family-3 protein